MNKINTVVFDMDGTVLNTLDDLTVSMNYVLEKFNMQGHTLDEYKAFFGNGIEYAMRKSVPEGTDDETISRMLPVFKEHYDKHCLDKTRPYDGILELMHSLKTKGYKMAIVSNKIDSAVKELQKKFFADLVDVAIGEKPGIKRKPAPDTVNEALRLLNSSPDEAIYIGDSEVDFATAKNSGLPCISVLWGFRDKEYLETIGAGTFAEKPEDILKILSDNIILIGMPTSGKSTVGVILAKLLGKDFIDTDLIIQKKTGKKLNEIIASEGLDGFIEIENNICSNLEVNDAIIATGGSVIYGDEAMQHFQNIGKIVYLDIDYDTLESRLHHTKQRGVVLREGQSKKELYDERVVLYRKYADTILNENEMGIEETVESLAEMISG